MISLCSLNWQMIKNVRVPYKGGVADLVVKYVWNNVD